MRGLILLGDATSHGGRVISGQQNYRVGGKPVACVGDQISCPQPGHGVNSIVEGHPTMTVNGKPVALHGHKGACGCSLISSHNGDHAHR